MSEPTKTVEDYGKSVHKILNNTTSRKLTVSEYTRVVAGIQKMLDAATTYKQEQEFPDLEEDDLTHEEMELARAILGALEYRGFYDCGKYIDADLIARIRPLMQKQEQEAFDVEDFMWETKKDMQYLCGGYHPEFSEKLENRLIKFITDVKTSSYRQGITEGEKRGAEKARNIIANLAIQNCLKTKGSAIANNSVLDKHQIRMDSEFDKALQDLTPTE